MTSAVAWTPAPEPPSFSDFRCAGSSASEFSISVEPNNLSYMTKRDVLPGRHVLVLNDNSSEKTAAGDSKDYAFFSLNPEGRIVAWYSGAERIYGYKGEEIIGQFDSCLYLDDDELRVDFHGQLKKTAAEGHLRKRGMA